MVEEEHHGKETVKPFEIVLVGRKSFRHTYHPRWPPSSAAAIQPLDLAFWMLAESTGRTLPTVVGERADARENQMVSSTFLFFDDVCGVRATI